MVTLYDEKEDKTIEFKFKGKVKALLVKTGHNPETVLVTRENELLTEDDTVQDTDKIEFRSVISGG
jgi:sulfur carrier protein ThiS